MKKICISLFLIFCIASIATYSNAIVGKNSSELQFVIDEADILSSSKITKLESQIKEIQEEYGLDVVIVTTYGTGGVSDRVFADDYYDYNGYGDDGLLLLINMSPKGWYISTAGKGITYFTDYGIEKIGEKIRPLLSDEKYDKAMQKFLDLTEEYIKQGETGKPYDTNNKYVTGEDIAIRVLISAAISAIIAGVVVGVMASKMNTMKRQANASVYGKNFNLTRSQDMFLYSNTTSRRIETSSSGGSSYGGGSSTHTSSSGRSHGGGGGRF